MNSGALKVSKFALSFVISSLFVSFSAFAGFTEDYDAIKNNSAKYEVIGTVCEQVAMLRLQEQFPAPKFTVVTGIAYSDENRTIGELDVVVFDNKSQNAVKVAEVKCWSKMSAGLNKAHDQRRRFLKAIAGKKHLYFESTDDHRRHGQDQFEGVRDFISFAQKGSVAVGYDQELPYTLEELMKMREMILSCKQQGQCANH